MWPVREQSPIIDSTELLSPTNRVSSPAMPHAYAAGHFDENIKGSNLKIVKSLAFIGMTGE